LRFTGADSGVCDVDGFNFLRFSTNGWLIPGDRLIITAMGCHGVDET
jgi:hypothetical protein